MESKYARILQAPRLLDRLAAQAHFRLESPATPHRDTSALCPPGFPPGNVPGDQPLFSLQVSWGLTNGIQAEPTRINFISSQQE